MSDPTTRVELGRTGLQVTQLALGTVPIGNLFNPVSDAEAAAVIDRCWEHGLRFFDTAPLYGRGLSEERLGRALRDRPRDEYVLATKVGRLLRRDVPLPLAQAAGGGQQGLYKVESPLEPMFDFSYDGVMRSFEESLARLGLDHVDVLHIHDPDDHYDEAIRGAYRALDTLRTQGVIKALGAGMNQGAMPARFAREANFDCFLLAGRYTLLDQAAQHELLPICQEKGIGIIIGGVYNSGILTDPDRPGITFNYRPAEQAWLEKARRIKLVCQRHDVPLMAAALQFPLAHPAITTILTGVRSIAEIDENVAMFRHPIPAALWADLKSAELLPEDAPTPA